MLQDLYCVRSDLGNLLKALGRLDEAKVCFTGETRCLIDDGFREQCATVWMVPWVCSYVIGPTGWRVSCRGGSQRLKSFLEMLSYQYKLFCGWKNVSRSYFKRDVTPVLMHWSYVSLAITHLFHECLSCTVVTAMMMWQYFCDESGRKTLEQAARPYQIWELSRRVTEWLSP